MLDRLNDKQKTAVLKEGNVLLTACPGSGKTRVIVHKLAYEVSKLEEKSKRKIIALTFTIRASEEIFRRLNTMGVESRNVWSGTLHSFCFEWIIKPYSCYLPELRNGYSIADESFCADLIQSLKDKYEVSDDDGEINLRFRRDGDPMATSDKHLKLLKEYHETLNLKKLIDFDMLLFYSYKILLLRPKIQMTLSHIFKLICVDEYQDTQDLLYAIISLIVKTGNGNTSLFLVGDVDQAIYGSLGGVAKTATEIKNEIGGLPIDVLTLSGNYRSNQKIIDFYSDFQTQKIAIKALGDNANDSGLITFNNSVASTQIVSEIARLIQCSLDRGISEDEICVLVPQWWLVIKISKQLRALLPEVKFDASGLAPMSKNRENIWYKLSRLLLTEPSPKLYSSRYKWATEFIDNLKTQTNSQFDETFSNERRLLKLINTISSDEGEGIDYLDDCFNQFLKATEIEIHSHRSLVECRHLYFENIKKRLADTEVEIPSDIESFKAFYKEISGVTINTCVGVKGEEFETVIAYGLRKGYLPHWNDIIDRSAQHTENVSKKLMYVICSRAKTNLHLISETGRKTKKGWVLPVTAVLENKSFNYDVI